MPAGQAGSAYNGAMPDSSPAQRPARPASEDRRALYLRWRPTSFADVVGQEHVVRTLRNAVLTGAPAHAYLLAGPRGTGKTSVARILFRAVNCEDQRGGDPCDRCPPCLAALAGRSLDLVEIDAASNRGIDDVRELREKIAFAPADVRYRVYIVDEAHELTGPAWDAFLKTLEEPPPHAIFVLATTEAHRIPGTILSRCQRFDFRRIRPDAISARLLEIAQEEGLALEPAAADRLARLARGGLRDGISLLDQAAAFTAGRVDLAALREALGLSDLQAAQQLLAARSEGDAVALLGGLVELAEAGADLRLFAEDLVALLRGILFASAGASQSLRGEFSADELVWLEEQAPRWPSDALRELLLALTDNLARTRDTSQFRLQLELALLAGCHLGGGEAAGWSSRPSVASPEPSRAEPAASIALARRLPREAAEPESHAFPIVSAPPADEATAQASTPAEAALGRPADEPPLSRAANGAPTLTLDRARDSWSRVIEWVARRNSFVASYLRPAELHSLEAGWLVLGFGFRVHHERVSELRNRALVEQACLQVLGAPLRLRCEFFPPAAQEGEIDLDDPVLKFALERFGGRPEIVER
jgi:DNA polymerase-3 subunit gamma/tau